MPINSRNHHTPLAITRYSATLILSITLKWLKVCRWDYENEGLILRTKQEFILENQK